MLEEAGFDRLELAVSDQRELSLSSGETMGDGREARRGEMGQSLEAHHRLVRRHDQRRGEGGARQQSQSEQSRAQHDQQRRGDREGGRPRGLLESIASEEAEARGSLEQSRAGGLRQRRGALARLRQSLDQQSARRGRGQRLWQRSGEALEQRSDRAKKGSEAASLLPEARGESMAQSHREEQSLESLRGDPLPWERGYGLERVRERREGRRAKRRSQHGKTAKNRGDRSPLPETIQSRGEGARALSPDCHISSQCRYAHRRIGA